MVKQNSGIDLFRYINALLVIAIHVRPLIEISFVADYWLVNVIGRTAVPFFFISSGYFMARNENKINYWHTYLWKLIKTYLLWSLLYLPFGIRWMIDSKIPYLLYPLALAYALFNVGTYYHLWYVPALIFSLVLIKYLRKYFSLKQLYFIAVLLYVIGSAETYSSFLNWPLSEIVNSYMRIFYTTRNGLFFGLVFVLTGYLCNEKTVKHSLQLTSLSFILLSIESFMLYQRESYNFNFLLMLIPFGFYSFQFISQLAIRQSFVRLRYFSTYYYFMHVLVMEVISEVCLFYQFEWWNKSGIFRFVLVVFATHLLAIGNKLLKIAEKH